jgi:dihydrofolate synthase/folylpolyglutamate synthase
MHQLMDLLGNPHKKLRIIHVAGTKGKGSTAAMVASVLGRCGLAVGLYTSPHLERLEERFVFQGMPCRPQDIVRLVETVRPAVEQMDRQANVAGGRGPTFFEVTTAMAFCYYAECRADVVVLEVGMGGRLDSTNVCFPELCIITSISFDHTRQLGNTLSAIAGEKAGIIKPGVPCVTSVRAREPLEVISRVADRQGARLYVIGRDFQVHSLCPSEVPEACLMDGEQGQDGQHPNIPCLQPPCIRYEEYTAQGTWQIGPLRLGLLGAHQADNAAAAIAALRRLFLQGWPIGEEAIRRGLAETRVAGRLELIGGSPLVILDVAHNVASAEALAEFLRQQLHGRRRRFILACSCDKDLKGILQALLPVADQVCLTRFTSNPRAADPEELLAIARSVLDQHRRTIPLDVAPDPFRAWHRVRNDCSPHDVICVTGSFYLVGELRQELLRAAGQLEERVG